jgi:hypothetical protein
VIKKLQKISRLLWEEWDPIGVNGIAPDDEYDSYALRVFSMLSEGKRETEIAQYLTWAVTENMGLSSSDHGQSIANHAALIAHKIIVIGDGLE